MWFEFYYIWPTPWHVQDMPSTVLTKPPTTFEIEPLEAMTVLVMDTIVVTPTKEAILVIVMIAEIASACQPHVIA